MVTEPEISVKYEIDLFGSKELILKLLGPTADYLGEGLALFTKKMAENLKLIFNLALRKLGKKIDTDGGVPPIILKMILDSGGFSEDQISIEYFAGILASSRSETSMDDRGKTFLSTISRISRYQIKAHYLFYTMFRKLYSYCEESLGFPEPRSKKLVYVSRDKFCEAMVFSANEDEKTFVPHIMFGLSNNGLIGTWQNGTREQLEKKFYIEDDGKGMVFGVSPYGLELYLWAHGMGHIPVGAFLSENTKYIEFSAISLPRDFKMTRPLI